MMTPGGMGVPNPIPTTPSILPQPPPTTTAMIATTSSSSSPIITQPLSQQTNIPQSPNHPPQHHQQQQHHYHSLYAQGQPLYIGDRIKLFTTSPYHLDSPVVVGGGYVGVAVSNPNNRIETPVISIPPHDQSTERFFRPQIFTILSSNDDINFRAQNGKREPVLFGMTLVLVSETGMVWNNKVKGLKGYLTPKPRGSTKGEIWISFNAPGKTLSNVCVGDTVMIDVDENHRQRRKYGHRLTAFRPEYSSKLAQTMSRIKHKLHLDHQANNTSSNNYPTATVTTSNNNKNSNDNDDDNNNNNHNNNNLKNQCPDNHPTQHLLRAPIDTNTTIKCTNLNDDNPDIPTPLDSNTTRGIQPQQHNIPHQNQIDPPTPSNQSQASQTDITSTVAMVCNGKGLPLVFTIHHFDQHIAQCGFPRESCKPWICGTEMSYENEEDEEEDEEENGVHVSHDEHHDCRHNSDNTNNGNSLIDDQDRISHNISLALSPRHYYPHTLPSYTTTTTITSAHNNCNANNTNNNTSTNNSSDITNNNSTPFHSSTTISIVADQPKQSGPNTHHLLLSSPSINSSPHQHHLHLHTPIPPTPTSPTSSSFSYRESRSINDNHQQQQQQQNQNHRTLPPIYNDELSVGRYGDDDQPLFSAIPRLNIEHRPVSMPQDSRRGGLLKGLRATRDRLFRRTGSIDPVEINQPSYQQQKYPHMGGGGNSRHTHQLLHPHTTTLQSPIPNRPLSASQQSHQYQSSPQIPLSHQYHQQQLPNHKENQQFALDDTQNLDNNNNNNNQSPGLLTRTVNRFNTFAQRSLGKPQSDNTNSTTDYHPDNLSLSQYNNAVLQCAHCNSLNAFPIPTPQELLSDPTAHTLPRSHIPNNMVTPKRFKHRPITPTHEQNEKLVNGDLSTKIIIDTARHQTDPSVADCDGHGDGAVVCNDIDLNADHLQPLPAQSIVTTIETTAALSDNSIDNQPPLQPPQTYQNISTCAPPSLATLPGVNQLPQLETRGGGGGGGGRHHPQQNSTQVHNNATTNNNIITVIVGTFIQPDELAVLHTISIPEHYQFVPREKSLQYFLQGQGDAGQGSDGTIKPNASPIIDNHYPVPPKQDLLPLVVYDNHSSNNNNHNKISHHPSPPSPITISSPHSSVLRGVLSTPGILAPFISGATLTTTSVYCGKCTQRKRICQLTTRILILYTFLCTLLQLENLPLFTLPALIALGMTYWFQDRHCVHLSPDDINKVHREPTLTIPLPPSSSSLSSDLRSAQQSKNSDNNLTSMPSTTTTPRTAAVSAAGTGTSLPTTTATTTMDPDEDPRRQTHLSIPLTTLLNPHNLSSFEHGISLTGALTPQQGLELVSSQLFHPAFSAFGVEQLPSDATLGPSNKLIPAKYRLPNPDAINQLHIIQSTIYPLAPLTPQLKALPGFNRLITAVCADMPQRFIEAEAGDVSKARDRWYLTKKWRNDNNLDRILSQPYSLFAVMRKLCGHFYHGFDREGNFIYVDRPGLIQFPKLRQAGASNDPEGVLQRHFLHGMEYQWNIINASPTGKCFSILDLQGLGFMTMVTGPALPFVKKLSGLLQQHYPVRSSRIIIVNVPSWFSKLWGVISPLLHERTRQKVVICGSDQAEIAKMLNQYVDPSQLPSFYGGACRCEGGCDVGHPMETAYREFVHLVNTSNGTK